MAAPSGRAQEAVISQQVPVSEAEWARIEKSIDRALEWLANQQASDGSFPTTRDGQPAITSFCVMAFLSRGHLPGEGRYGEHLQRAIDYVLSCQNRNGMLSLTSTPDTACYNHAISGLMLSEVCGMTRPEQTARIRSAVERMIEFSFEQQNRPKPHPEDKGGWRYHARPNDNSVLSDLSMTSWQLMFMRSARNAGFKIDAAPINAALDYVKSLYYPPGRTFGYAFRYRGPDYTTRAMTGAGILSLSLAGEHNTRMARDAADWVLAHPFDRYGDQYNDNDVYHYSAYYCCHAMFQVGGRHWREFYPPFANTLVANQQRNGSWPRDRINPQHARLGEIYTTSLAVMALCVPGQLLPIYQR